MPVGFRCRTCHDLIAWVGYPDGIPRGQDSLRVDPDEEELLDVFCQTENNAKVEDQHADTWVIWCKKRHRNPVSRVQAKGYQRAYIDPDRQVAIPIVIA